MMILNISGTDVVTEQPQSVLSPQVGQASPVIFLVFRNTNLTSSFLTDGRNWSRDLSSLSRVLGNCSKQGGGEELLGLFSHGGVVWHLEEVDQAQHAQLPVVETNEAVSVVDPLLDEMSEDAAAHSGQLDLVQDLQQEGGVVVEGSDNHLEYVETEQRNGKTVKAYL